ncbi:MAG: hypothetical protein NZ951_02145 [Dehalococcoidia bacterium]|nr:hypothetical protein [Dehalococcoidia bacterium]MDW8119628.1 hypothetical protein [Chloroflexota bacterium]
MRGVTLKRMRRERAARACQVKCQGGIASLLVAGPTTIRYLEVFAQGDIQPGDHPLLVCAEHDSVVFGNAGTYFPPPDQVPWITREGNAVMRVCLIPRTSAK